MPCTEAVYRFELLTCNIQSADGGTLSLQLCKASKVQSQLDRVGQDVRDHCELGADPQRECRRESSGLPPSLATTLRPTSRELTESS